MPQGLAGAAAGWAAGRLVGRVGGERPTMILGMVMTVAGVLLMALMSAGAGVAVALVLAGGIVQAAGKLITQVALTITATAGAGVERKGLSAGLLQTSALLGSAWGLSVLAAVIAARTCVPAGAGPEALVATLRWAVLAVVPFVALALLVVTVGLQGQNLRQEKTVEHARPGHKWPF